MKQWRSLPRSKRDRLTKKQIAKIDKPDLMSDAFGITEVKSQKKGKGMVVVVEEKQFNQTNDSMLYDFNMNKNNQTTGIEK